MRTFSWTAAFLFLGQWGLGAVSDAVDSPALLMLRRAEKVAEESPGKAASHVQLAQAWVLRGMEVDLDGCFRKAEAAADRALELKSANLPARKLKIQALLGQRRFEGALELAVALNRKNLDDVEVYGWIAEAAAALGRYEQAEEAAQWMLDLRPGQAESLLTTARLRELFGDLEGAADFLNRVLPSLSPDHPQTEVRALSDLGRLLRLQGYGQEAERVLKRALQILPDSPFALEEMARLLGSQGKAEESIELLRRRARVSPGPDRLYDLAVALDKAGRSEEAKQTFSEFETAALPLRSAARNANLELILYWADVAGKPAEALGLARGEFEHRRDVFTRDALAWALYANGNRAEAEDVMQAALAVGVRDPDVLAHEARIKKHLP